MYEFPPTAWQIHGLGWSSATGYWLTAFVVLLFILVRWRRSSFWVSGFWAFSAMTGTILAFNSLPVYSPYRSPVIVDVMLKIGLLLVCGIGVVRALWAGKGKADGGGFAAMIAPAFAAVFLFGSLLLPRMGYPRVNSARAQCKNRLRQIGIAFHNYHDVHQLFPPAKISKPSKSWRVNLLPFVDQKELYDAYLETAAWDSDVNRPLTLQPTRVFECPGRPERVQTNAEGQFLTAYTVPVGRQSIFDGSQQVRMQSIEDGTSNTLMVVESCGTDIVWSEPRDSDLTKVDLSVNVATSQIDRSNSLLSSYHPGSAQALLADGSVRTVSNQIDANLLKALITKAAGDDSSGDW